MKLSKTTIDSIQPYRRIILAGTLASAALLTAACNDKPAEKVQAAQTAQAISSPSAPAAKIAIASLPKVSETKSLEKAAAKQPTSKTLRYRSRDYAVSFEYPWQYSLANARKISEEKALQPKPDGHDGQITLARIDLPKGFYPDTNFESGYFTLSLNPVLKEHDCSALVEAGKPDAAQITNINDTDFLWVESENGGKGATSKVRNYASFVNDACYEVELGVTTRNENGLANEVNVDRVMQKLEGILKTVRIGGNEAKSETADLQSSKMPPKTVDKK